MGLTGAITQLWPSHAYMPYWKDSIEILSYGGAALAAIISGYTYWRAERARWLTSLYEKFFESDTLKGVRELLDSGENLKIREIVVREDPFFSDYLNFFEYVAILVRSRQLLRRDVLRLFDYYLRSLKMNGDVLGYIENPAKGYEQLRSLLRSVV